MFLLIILILVALALLFVRFKIVEEGTAIVLVSFGAFSKAIIQWENHWIDEDWNIWKEGEENSDSKEENKCFQQRIFGGLIFYIWPFQKIFTYLHRWADIRLKYDETVIEFHEEIKDCVMLKPAVYAIKVSGTETKDGLVVDLIVLVTLKIINPFLFLFVAPPTPLEDVLSKITAEIRTAVANLQINEVLGGKIWEKLQTTKLLQETLLKWGLKVAEKGIEVKEVIFPPEHQEALAREKIEKFKSRGRAQDIMGTIISAISLATGEEERVIQEQFKNDPETFLEKYKTIIDNIMKKLSMEEKAYYRIEGSGKDNGLVNDLLQIITAWKMLPTTCNKNDENKDKNQISHQKEPHQEESHQKNDESKEQKKDKSALDNLPKEERKLIIQSAEMMGWDPEALAENWLRKKEEEKRKI